MIIDDTAKGGLTIFWELFTVMCVPKHLKRKYHHYLKTFGSNIETVGFLQIEEATL